MLETEFKSIITEDAFNKIKNHYRWDSVKVQENHYYVDENGELSKSKTTFRIRLKDGEYKIQIKVHKNNGSSLQICEETEFFIDNAPKTISAQEAKQYTNLDIGNLIKIGFNKTLRYSLMWNNETEICLDKTEYFDMIDYEIEVEYKNQCPKQLIAELEDMGIRFDAPAKGKYTRFIERLQLANKENNKNIL